MVNKLGLAGMALGVIALVVGIAGFLKGQATASSQQQVSASLQSLGERLEGQVQALESLRRETKDPSFAGLPDRVEGLAARIEELANLPAPAAELPVGTIVAWDPVVRDASGRPTVQVRSLPEGWARCDGTKGTPNLTGLFLRGDELAGSLGGADRIHTGPVSSGHDLNRHQHASPLVEKDGVILRPSAAVPFGITTNTFSHQIFSEGQVDFTASDLRWILTGPVHEADLNTHTHTVDLVPRHYAVIYIMKISATTHGS